MGYLVFFLLYLGMLILTFIFSFYSCKKYYFFLDTVIIGIFLLIGTIDSWGLRSLTITSWYFSYMLCRFIILLFIFIIRKIRKTTIVFETRNTLQKLLASFNIIINFILFFPVIGQLFMASSV